MDVITSPRARYLHAAEQVSPFMGADVWSTLCHQWWYSRHGAYRVMPGYKKRPPCPKCQKRLERFLG